MNREEINALIAIISNDLKGNNLKVAKEKGYVKETPEYNLPNCKKCSGVLNLQENIDNRYLIYTCDKGHQETFTKEELKKYNKIYPNLEDVLRKFINVLFADDLKSVKEKEPNSYILRFKEGYKFITTFLLDTDVVMEDLAYLALQIAQQRTPWICFFNETFAKANRDRFYKMTSLIPLGIYFVMININDRFTSNKVQGTNITKGIKDFNQEIKQYTELYNNITEKEKNLVVGFNNKEGDLKKFIFEIDSNPKLLLSQTIRFIFDRGSLNKQDLQNNWNGFQNLAKLAFSVIYNSNPTEGAHLFKNEPDFVFKYVEKTIGESTKLENRRHITHFFGIGDCKFLGYNKKLKLNAELTEKYLRYFRDARTRVEADKVVELIIFYNSDFSIKAEEFVDRLYETEELTKKDIVVFFDSWAFLSFLNKYLSLIVKSTKDITQDKDSKIDRPEDLLHPDILNKYFARPTKNKNNIYYILDKDTITTIL